MEGPDIDEGTTPVSLLHRISYTFLTCLCRVSFIKLLYLALPCALILHTWGCPARVQCLQPSMPCPLNLIISIYCISSPTLPPNILLLLSFFSFYAFLYVPPAPTDEVPMLVTETIAYLKSKGLDSSQAQGIFRKSANAVKLRQIKTMYNSGEKVDYESLGQVSSCANALKAFFRELREPAFDTDSYSDIIQLMDEGKADDVRTPSL